MNYRIVAGHHGNGPSDGTAYTVAGFELVTKLSKMNHLMKERATDEGSLPEIVQYGASSCFERLTASKGSNKYFYCLCENKGVDWSAPLSSLHG